MSKLHEYFGKKEDEKVEVKKEEFISSTVEETAKADDIPKETKEETKKDSFVDEILKDGTVSLLGAYGGDDDKEESVRKEYFRSHTYPYIPNPLGIRSNNAWYGSNRDTFQAPPIGGIRFVGFLNYPTLDKPICGPDKYNERMEKVMGNLTGKELEILSETTIMHSKDEVQRYIDIITKLINMGMID